MHLIFTLGMSHTWHILWAVLLTGLWMLYQPKLWFIRFLAFAATATFLVWIVYTFYVFYWVNPDRSLLFPFDLFSGYLRAPKEQWHPYNSEDRPLCDLCQKFLHKSKLTMGSSLPLVKLVEWYPFYDTIEKIRPQADSPTSSSTTCFVCHLLWFPMSESRRESLTGSPLGPLKIKVWEERPLSSYTYVQLHSGKKALGSRLLVHRGDCSQQPCRAMDEPATNSTAHMDQAKSWIAMCQENHTLCKDIAKVDSRLPTRLIRVEPPVPGSSVPRIRLVDTQKMNSTSYIALSHCWGKKKIFRLLQSNKEECYEAIDFTKLSKNMQDAALTVLGLGYSYLWIDSLCIIQEDKEDWDKESRTMADVYSGAVCTIAATSSASSEGGCFRERNPSYLQPFKIGSSSESNTEVGAESIYVRFDDMYDFERHVDKAPLNTRGWVFQERMLSPRILHFGSRMVYWECWQRSASEAFPLGYTNKKYPDDFRDNYSPTINWIYNRAQLEQAERDSQSFSWAYKKSIKNRPPPPAEDPDDTPKERENWIKRLRFWQDIRKASEDSWCLDSTKASGFRVAFHRLQTETFTEKVGPSSFTYLWYEIAEAYARSELSYNKDKLVAIASMSKLIEEKHDYTYVAGIWKESLLTDLLWFIREGEGRRLTMQSSTENSTQMIPVCPTWTWASVEGKIGIDLVPENARYSIRVSEEIAEIQDVSMTIPSDGDASTTPLSGRLQIRAPLLRRSEATRRGRAWQIQIGDLHKSPRVRFLPDVEAEDPSAIPLDTIACLPILELETSVNFDDADEDTEWKIQGLVLKRCNEAGQDGNPVFERLGLFIADHKSLSRKARRAILDSDKTTVEVV
ncbi:hypothetical protein M426DRAFT_323533 [Hypoxylon sp. CI-4A]|nr:hypothetical protein M426DRAFT_323533 [Hypoxylon sp. CI-4A]